MKRITLVLIWSIINSCFYAQISEGDRPFTFINAQTRSQADSLFGNYHIETLSQPNIASAVAQDIINDAEGLSYRVGIVVPTHLSIHNSGTWTVLPDGSKIWRLGIRIREAQALSLYFAQDVVIPTGGKLNAYNESQTQYIGSFSANTPAFQAMEMIQGELLTLEYYMPSGETQLPSIYIDGVSYYYRGVEDRIAGFRESTLNQNRGPHLSCHVDVACSEANGWTNQRDAVVHYTFRTGLFSTSMCSAAIINNTANDCTPYVLSANHCGEPTSNSDINGHVWYFNYQRPTCTPGNTSQYNGARSQTMSGGTLKASSELGTAPSGVTHGISGSDFYLAELNSSIPSSYNAYYAGWRRSSTRPTSGVGIHHPKGDEKKISTYTAQPSLYTYDGGWSNAHMRVNWRTTTNGSGTLEGGSSGSPVFNQNGLIVGVATASNLQCASNGGYGIYGRMYRAWDLEGSNSSQRLKPWLDPLNTGVSSLNGTYAPCSSNGGGGSSTGTCSTPIAITCGTPFNGTTVDGQNNIGAYSCDATKPEQGNEKIHSITITQQSDLTATLSNLNGVDLDVHILSGCVSGGCLARDDISATATNLAPGTYLISVDGYGNSGSQQGSYTLTVNCTPTSGGGGGNSTGDCSNPIAITCGTPFNGTTVDGQNNIGAYSCDATKPEQGNEKIHSITITQQSDLTATLSNLNGVDLDVHILSGCVSGGCLARDDISATATNLAPGTYLISVDGYGNSGSQQGSYTLNVTCTPTGGGGGNSTGDCSNPITITCGTPFNGTTVDGQNNITAYTSCAPQPENGKEKIHSITITQQSDLTATLSNLNGVDLDVHILSGCVSGGCLARDDISATATNLAPGTYLISVDGYGNSGSQQGSYTLNVTCTPTGGGGGGNSTGDCSNPIAITCGTPFNGTTVDGQNNITAYTSCAPQPENGKEKIHSITITQQSDLTATLSNLNGVDLDVHILSSCTTGGCLARDDNSATATSLAPGTYLIAVDGYGNTGSQEGTYTLTVNCTPTGGGGGGNSTGDCSNPIAITCGTPFNGTTVDGQNNITAYTSCAPQPENGKEKIHSITITQQSDLMATLSNLNGVDLDVHILSGCVSGGCLARDDISATATSLAPGTYLIAVDGYGNTGSQEGTYTLTVNCTPTGGGGGCTPESSSFSQTICQGDSYTFGSQQLTTTGTYTNTYTNVGGCDSVVTLNLNVIPTTSSTDLQTICQGDVYIFGNQALSQAGTYTEVYTNSNGCDSTVTLTLQVVQLINNSISETTCQSNYVFGTQNLTQTGTYTETFQTVNGCDSTVTLSLTILTGSNTTIYDTICSGDSAQLGNQYYVSGGTYSQTFTGINGCDSVVILNLTVQAAPVITINMVNGDLVSSIGSDYQWYLDGNMINGATSQNYTPTNNGVYSVVTSGFNGCHVEQVYNLQNVGIAILQNGTGIKVYPNPNNGQFNIETNEPIEFKITNVLGEIIYQSSSKIQNHQLNLDLSKGVYHINVKGTNEVIPLLIE